MDDLDPKAIARARMAFKNKHQRLAAQVDSWNDLNFLNKAKITILLK
ncbi:MAG: hypothetical protein U9N81_12065 [Bacillota bacterium]|nr:hypothetical protein [Bacillota bacterium]